MENILKSRNELKSGPTDQPQTYPTRQMEPESIEGDGFQTYCYIILLKLFKIESAQCIAL